MCRSALVFASVFLLMHCAPKPTEKIDLSKTRASFMLSDGSSISTDAYDEYNPILITRDDGYLVLLFASDRDCGACTTGYHNLFVAVSTEPYYDDLTLPAFNTPVAVLPDGASAADSISRLEFVAEASGPNVIVGYSNVSNIYTFILDTAGQSSGAGTGYAPAGNTTRGTDSLLGFGPEPGSMLSRDGSGVVRYSSITTPHNGRKVTNSAFGTADTITRIHPSYTGFLGATFIADSGYLMMGTLYENFGYHPNFQEALDDAGIFLTSAQVFDAGNSADDLLLFSAHDGQSEDLYAIDSHTVGDLWAQVGIYGGYNDSTELRNIWYPVVATLPGVRGYMAATVYGTKGYFFGGSADGTNGTNTVYEFDFPSETFTNCGGSCGTLPGVLTHGAAAVGNGLIYVIAGGTDTTVVSATTTVNTFNPGTFAIVGASALPVLRMGHSAVYSGGKIYAMGGGSNSGCDAGTGYGCTENYALDVGTGIWSGALAVVPHNFTAGALVEYGGSIFAFAGYINSSILETNAVNEFNSGSLAWTNCGGSCTNLSTGRFGLGATTANGYIYIMGGMNQALTPFNVVEEFDPVSYTYSDCDGGCATLPVAIMGGSVLEYGGNIYYFGGKTGALVNTIYKYIP